MQKAVHQIYVGISLDDKHEYKCAAIYVVMLVAREFLNFSPCWLATNYLSLPFVARGPKEIKLVSHGLLEVARWQKSALTFSFVAQLYVNNVSTK